MIVRAVRIVGMAVALATAASGCAGSSGAQPRDVVTPKESGAASAPGMNDVSYDAESLVGSWHVAAVGEEPDASLIIGDHLNGEIVLFRECGMLDGDWRANKHGMFVADLFGGDSKCFPAARQSEPDPLDGWWRKVTGFRPDDTGELLVDASGRTVARLTPGAHPTAGPHAAGEYASPPVMSSDVRKRIAEPAALPDGLIAATPQDVLGTWVPTDGRPSNAHVSFGTDGSYAGSDGCNGSGGRYLVGPAGIVLATGGPTTLIGCENSPVSTWVIETGRLGLRDNHLVFVSPEGTVLGEAKRP